jgi:putative lipoprotein (rSAM/lipoprotein system)
MKIKLCGTLLMLMSAVSLTSCFGDNGPFEEYGTEMTGTYIVLGSVTDENYAVLEGKQVILRLLGESNSDQSKVDYSKSLTVLTGKEGNYKFTQDLETKTNKLTFRVVCKDPTGQYESDSVKVTLSATGGSDDYLGQAIEQVDFHLKKK